MHQSVADHRSKQNRHPQRRQCKQQSNSKHSNTGHQKIFPLLSRLRLHQYSYFFCRRIHLFFSHQKKCFLHCFSGFLVLCKKLHQPFPLFPDFCCCDRHPKRRVQIFFPAHRHCVVDCVKNRIEIQVIPGNRVHAEVFPCFSSQTRFQFFFLFPFCPFLLLFSPFLPQLYQLLFLFISVILYHPNSQQYQNHKNSCCRVQFFHVLSPSFFLLCIISLLILSYSSTEPSSLPDFVAKIISTAACTASLCELLPSPMQVERVSIF